MIILIIAASYFTPTILAAPASKNMEAVWMATVFNIDFPGTKNDITAQKNEYIEKLDKMKAIGINTVVVQVRPKADALYKSDINPWSDVLTGIQGKDPGYDPLAFMIEETHKRDMAFHAWLNPFRITTSGTDLSTLSENHPARLNPNWVISYNNSLYYNPELQEVKNHIIFTVEEIIRNYKVDAIHFDDYFYPSNYPLPQGEEKDGSVANSRIQHINDMVQGVSAAIKSINSNVLFGISPMGIWKNNISDPTGSETSGSQSYYTVYADTRTWIKSQWIDYVVPQIYWETGNKAADYETLVKWWSNEVKGTNVDLYIGHGIYKDAVVNEIDKQLRINQKYSEVNGSFYYGMKNLLANTAGCIEKILVINHTSPLESSRSNMANVLINSSPQVKTGTITASILNIRGGNGLQYTILTKVPRGTKVTILNSQPGWYNVKLTNGKTGWASADYVTVIDQPRKIQ